MRIHTHREDFFRGRERDCISRRNVACFPFGVFLDEICRRLRFVVIGGGADDRPVLVDRAGFQSLVSIVCNVFSFSKRRTNTIRYENRVRLNADNAITKLVRSKE